MPAHRTSGVRVYGFRGCDTVRAAVQWLDVHRVPFTFIDYRRDTLTGDVIDDWFARAGWERAVNRKATTFKALPDTQTSDLDAPRARALLLAETNVIKRPVLDTGDALLFGFSPDAWSEALGISP